MFLATKIWEEVAELRVDGADESEFLFAAPTFDLLFTSDGVFDVTKRLEVNEPCYVMVFRETCGKSLFVLDGSNLEVVGNTYVKNAVRAGENVDVVYRHCGAA